MNLVRGMLLVGLGAIACAGTGEKHENDDDKEGKGNDKGTGQAALCVDRCSEDAQCPAPLTCADGRCACASHDDCKLQGAACESDADCTDGRCVVWNGAQLCATEAAATPPFCGTLLDPASPMTVDLADGTGTASVCPSAEDMECRQGECRVPCGSCSFPPGIPHCDDTSGKCVCTTEPTDSCAEQIPGTRCLPDGTCGCAEDARCYGETPKCELATGRCICESDDDCAGQPCIDGVCSCSDHEECQGIDLYGDPFDRDGYPETPSVCEPL